MQCPRFNREVVAFAVNSVMGKKVVGNKVAFSMGKTDFKKGWLQAEPRGMHMLSIFYQRFLMFLDPAHKGYYASSLTVLRPSV